MSDLFVEVSRSSAPMAIEEQIKDLIVSRQLVAGDPLPPERQFAAQLGVSRSTLREALRALTEEGLVTARQGSGWTVKPNGLTAATNLAVYFRLNGLHLDQIVEARLASEPTIARLAAQRRSDEELAAIERGFEAMSAVQTTPRAFLDADSDFHALVANAAHNMLLSFSLHPTMALLKDTRLEVVAQEGGTAQSQVEHAQIVEAIRARDGEAAERAMRDHIASFSNRGRPVVEPAER